MLSIGLAFECFKARISHHSKEVVIHSNWNLLDLLFPPWGRSSKKFVRHSFDMLNLKHTVVSRVKNKINCERAFEMCAYSDKPERDAHRARNFAL